MILTDEKIKDIRNKLANYTTGDGTCFLSPERVILHLLDTLDARDKRIKELESAMLTQQVQAKKQWEEEGKKWDDQRKTNEEEWTG